MRVAIEVLRTIGAFILAGTAIATFFGAVFLLVTGVAWLVANFGWWTIPLCLIVGLIITGSAEAINKSLRPSTR